MKENKMGTMPINKLIINMSLPLITSMLVQALYNVVDSFFVSKINEGALTAVSLAFPIQNLILAFSVGVGIGVNALLSRYLGAKNRNGIEKVVNNGIFLGILNAIIFAILGLLFTKWFFSMQKTSETITNYGIQYVTICTTVSFAIIMEILFERILQSTGKTVYSMITQAIGAIINVILDPILIFGLFGFPRMEVAGAAIATVIGQTIAMLLALYLNLSRNKEITFNFKKFKPEWEVIKTIYRIGIPSIVMQSIFSFLLFQINGLLLTFSSTATAVYGIYFKVQGLVLMPVFGLNNAVISIISYNYGANKLKRVVETIKKSVIYSFGIMALGFLGCQIFSVNILKIFDASDEMIKIGTVALRVMSINFLMYAYTFVSAASFQALDKGFYSLVISLVRQLLLNLPLAYLFAGIFGLDGVWWAFPISEVIAVILTAIFTNNVYKEKILKRNK